MPMRRFLLSCPVFGAEQLLDVAGAAPGAQPGGAGRGGSGPQLPSAYIAFALPQ